MADEGTPTLNDSNGREETHLWRRKARNQGPWKVEEDHGQDGTPHGLRKSVLKDRYEQNVNSYDRNVMLRDFNGSSLCS